MTAPRKIGVLGGMGPEATVMFMARVIQHTKARDDADHIPMIVDNNTQIPSRIKRLIEGQGEDPVPTLAAMARGLEAQGAQALAMPCNTAHNYAAEIQAAVRIPLLNMVELTARQILNTAGAGKPVGILASPAIKITGIYDKAFAALGLRSLYPEDQDRILAAIRAIKASSTDAGAREIFADACRELHRRGAGTMLVGCSEFSIIADAVPDGLPAVDSVDVLVNATIGFALA
ncbi:amino acid racemase [Ferrovibrio sp.]|uniref:aspartate/glutamate racemase family protein n=1 Tax=Ferrovibrio sp. TaxID=1917215 RepID=UPI0025B8B95A|nr:amino acid racemase [Ferrovibrio sp.]MBX3453686.1 aspartate/glutamate racemase family protein [Ferrovibrio sp.]